MNSNLYLSVTSENFVRIELSYTLNNTQNLITLLTSQAFITDFEFLLLKVTSASNSVFPFAWLLIFYCNGKFSGYRVFHFCPNLCLRIFNYFLVKYKKSFFLFWSHCVRYQNTENILKYLWNRFPWYVHRLFDINTSNFIKTNSDFLLFRYIYWSFQH